MATDFERLTVQVSAEIRGFRKEMAKLVGISKRDFNKIERRAVKMDTRLSKVGVGLRRSLLASTAGISAAFSVREIQRYADAWTQAGNKIRASSQVAGRAGRSLEGVIEIANRSRTGLTETSDLYSKLLRATRDVAESELQVAKATEIVNKAFKAGGAALSEQRAGILQLSQALGSGLLQGDELRSVRENAPLIAQALAREFNTTIAGLKKLGADGELAIDRVFKAILAAEKPIGDAFAKTNATIGDSFTRVNNAFTQYIGQADAAHGTSRQLVSALTALADNFETTADIAFKFAGIIAAGLLGRSIGRMIVSLNLGTGAILKLAQALSFARLAAAGGIAGAAAAGLGALPAIIGLAGAALFAYTVSSDNSGDSSETAARKASLYAKALGEIKAEADKARKAVDDFNNAGSERGLKVAVDVETSVEEELKKAVEATKKLLDDQADQLEKIADLREKFGGNPSEVRQIKNQVDQLRSYSRELRGTSASAKDLEQKINRFSRLNPGFAEFATDADKLTDEVDKQARAFVDAAAAARQAAAGISELGAQYVIAQALFEKGIQLDVNRSADARNQFLQERLDESGRSSDEKTIQTRMDQILKDLESEAKETGKTFRELNDAALRKQAIDELAAESLAKLTDATNAAAENLIKKFEGKFFAEPFRDINERGEPDRLRIGFSSDTVTLSDGSVHAVVAGMRITLEDANRDLARRIAEAQENIRSKIGDAKFSELTAEQQAVLTSIVYNFGRLPAQIVQALKEGDVGDVANAIRGASTGVNRDRRGEEADIFLGGASIEIQAREARRDVILQTAQALREQNELIGLEAGLTGASNATRESEILRRETINALIAEFGTLTSEEIALIDQVVAGRFLQVTALDAAAEATDRLQEAQEDLERTQRQIGDAFQSAIKGFISDLRQGKDATEALSNAVGRLADRLLDIALNQIFKSLFSAFTLPAFADGGLTGLKNGGQVQKFPSGGLFSGRGGPRDDKNIIAVSNKEFIVNARSTKKHRGLLEAINSDAIKSFADGGFLGGMKRQSGGGGQSLAAAPATIVNNKVINTFDAASFLSEALASPSGESVLLNFVSARPAAFKSAMAG